MTRAAVFMAVAIAAGAAPPAAAQTSPGLAFRPYVMAAEQQFTARQTFDAAFGRTLQPFFGGGLNVTQEDGAYLDLSASRFRKTGEQAVVHGGEIFRLGIAQRVTVTPFEMTAGYRFLPRVRPARPPARVPARPGPAHVIPYIGGGFGLYRYQQTSDFATEDENVDTNHLGAIVEGGVELRLQRWVGLTIDGHYTYVPGILGTGGVSREAGEKDLGGLAGRVRLIIGR